MSAINNIFVYDGASTPVAHTLIPVSVTKEKGVVTALWREALAGVPTYAQVYCTMKIEQLKNGVYRTERRIAVPVMEAVSGQNASGYTAAPKVAYEDSDLHVGFFHERSISTGRKLVRMMGTNLSNNVITSVAAASAGPEVELFDLLVAPN